MRRLIGVIVFLTAFGGFFPFYGAHAAGASLYIGPASGSFAVGNTFTVSIYVNTGGKAVNAVQADLIFPPDKLQVVSPSTGKSFIQVWVTQPAYSNSAGVLHFQGTVPTPGIDTNAGLISTVTFRVVNTGVASVQFSDTSKVLLNDGSGTNELNETSGGIYTLTVPPPAGPIVTSPTNPDQEKWYKTDSVVLRWTSSRDAQEFSYMMSDLPVDDPDDIVDATNTFAVYNRLADGVHYFHIKSLRGGLWGGVTTYAVRIDNTPPAAFAVKISPGDRTANQNPIFTFSTTDVTSGIDHYELKIVPLDPRAALAAKDAHSSQLPFFIEVSSPYIQELPLGRYDVIVRAYDTAGNFYQTTKEITIVSPLFEAADGGGLRIGGGYVLAWPYVIIASLVIFAILVYFLGKLWKLHRHIELRLLRGAAGHPEIAEKLEELKQKQREYEDMIRKLSVAVVLLLGSLSWLGRGAQAGFARAAAPPPISPPISAPAASDGPALSPPVINLYRSSIANNEILYIGGWANAAEKEVVVHVEQVETGNTFSGSTMTDAKGNWLYSSPQFMDSGHYVVWAQLRSGEVASQPSARVDITVAPTALQIGNTRFNYEDIYFLLFLFFLLADIIIVALIIYHARHFRIKKAKLVEAIRDAEESLRRGFSLLRRDIELELATVEKAKLRGDLSEEEKAREAKLMRDLTDVSRYIGKEVWRIEEEEKAL